MTMPTFHVETGNIFIFKTNIKYKRDTRKLAPVLDKDCRILTWSVDTGDSDKVLRVVSNGMPQQEIATLVQNLGFSCEELID